MAFNIDDEWENFITMKNSDISSDEEDEIIKPEEKMSESDILDMPTPSDIYISTKSKIAYLNQDIDLKDIFWKIPIIPYEMGVNGVIKKQIKINSINETELCELKEHLKKAEFYEEQIITSINNPTGRIQFKDIRKISVGISKKDLMSYRCKKKSAFYNCFVLILRILINNTYKEFHVKVFNTGKLEIPGIQTEEIYKVVLSTILLTIQPFVKEGLDYIKTSDTILINSNFSCGYYINREVLYDILKFKYNIECIYDPCSYPGIQCKFYYDKSKSIQNGNKDKELILSDIIKSNNNIGKTVKEIAKEEKQARQLKHKEDKENKDLAVVSFMIFRTGSILIVGMCDENVLHIIYDYLTNILKTEYSKIGQQKIQNTVEVKEKKKKIKKKTITISK
jgi:hypothetical protein